MVRDTRKQSESIQNSRISISRGIIILSWLKNIIPLGEMESILECSELIQYPRKPISRVTTCGPFHVLLLRSYFVYLGAKSGISGFWWFRTLNFVWSHLVMIPIKNSSYLWRYEPIYDSESKMGFFSSEYTHIPSWSANELTVWYWQLELVSSQVVFSSSKVPWDSTE